MDESVQSASGRVVLDPVVLEALAFALKLYLWSDQCECEEESCQVGCEMCKYCGGRTALSRIGEEP